LYLRIGSMDDGVAHGNQVSQVQTAINNADIMSDFPAIAVDGNFQGETDGAVREYQKRVFPGQPREWDGIVGPKTRAFLFKPTDGQSTVINGAMGQAPRWLKNVTDKLGLADVIFPSTVMADTRTKVMNVFNFDPFPPDDADLATKAESALKLAQLGINFAKLRASFNETIPVESLPMPLFFSAFVFGEFEDPTVHFLPSFFDDTNMTPLPERRIATIIHERAHTALRISGHPGLQDGEGTFLTLNPPDDPFLGQSHPSFDDAIKNAYCYEFLSAALQPDFNRNRWFPGQIVGNRATG
jgi:hypothetical protein